MKKIASIAAAALAFCCVWPLSSMNVLASGEAISVSVDKSNVQVGDTVTITVTARSDQEIYEGSYEVYVDGASIGSVDFDASAMASTITNTFTFTASKEGSYTVSVKDPVDLVVLVDNEMVSVPVSPNSVTVTATVPTTAAPATEAPTTAAPTTEAPTTAAPTTAAPVTEAPTTAAPATITGIQVTYAGGDKKAGDTVSGIELSVVATYSDGSTQPISGWGCDQVGQPLQEGDNIFSFRYQEFSTEITITAQAGETAASSEENPSETDESTETDTTDESNETDPDETETEKIPYIQVVSPFGEDDLYLASDWNVTLPDGFEEDTISYAGYDVKVAKNDNDLILAYMTDKEGENGEFYIYDPDTQKFSYYTGIPVSGNTYYILSMPDDFDDTGLTKMTLSVDGKTMNAYQLSDSQADGIVCLVYATDLEGNKGFYRFDTGLKTFVRYYADIVKNQEEQESTSDENGETVSREIYDSLADRYKSESWMKIYIIIALIVLAIILFIFVIVLAMKLRKIYNEYDFIDDDEEESDEESPEEEDEDSDTAQEVSYDDDEFRVDLSSMEDPEDQ